MKTVEQAAAEYLQKCKESEIEVYMGDEFIAGVEWAQEWISVENELPTECELVLIKYRCDAYELPMNVGRLRMCISFYSTPAKKWQVDNNCKVVFWRPIERV